MKMVRVDKTLDAAGVDYTTLSVEESCCGFPLFLMGAVDEFKANAGKLIERVKITGA